MQFPKIISTLQVYLGKDEYVLCSIGNSLFTFEKDPKPSQLSCYPFIKVDHLKDIETASQGCMYLKQLVETQLKAPEINGRSAQPKVILSRALPKIFKLYPDGTKIDYQPNTPIYSVSYVFYRENEKKTQRLYGISTICTTDDPQEALESARQAEKHPQVQRVEIYAKYVNNDSSVLTYQYINHLVKE